MVKAYGLCYLFNTTDVIKEHPRVLCYLEIMITGTNHCFGRRCGGLSVQLLIWIVGSGHMNQSLIFFLIETVGALLSATLFAHLTTRALEGALS